MQREFRSHGRDCGNPINMGTQKVLSLKLFFQFFCSAAGQTQPLGSHTILLLLKPIDTSAKVVFGMNELMDGWPNATTNNEMSR